MFYYNEYLGIIYFNRYLNAETLNIISSYDEDEIALFEDTCEDYYEEPPED